MRVLAPRAVRPLELPADLAGRVHGLGADGLPPEMIAAAKPLILDTLAVAWAGSDAAGMDAVWRTARAEGGAGRSRYWTRNARGSAAGVAFHNASLASALDFDTLHEAGGVHADAVVLAAALAVADEVDACGLDLLKAYAAGAELVIRLGLATRSTTGWFRTSTYGVFGAAVAAARLLGLDRDAMGAALGLALAQAGGTQQGHAERRLSKRVMAGFAARDGVTAARLAAHGLTAPEHALDGTFGLFALFDEGEPAAVLDGWGTTFALTRTSIKKFPACACSHAAIEAALRIAGTPGFAPARVARVEARITPYMRRVVGAPYVATDDPEVTGQFCLAYGIAAALARGRFTVGDLHPDAVRDPTLAPLLARVVLTVDPAAEGRLAPAEIVVDGHDGARWTARVEALPGGPERPLSAAESRSKASAALAGRHPSPQALVSAVEELEKLARVAVLPL